VLARTRGSINSRLFSCKTHACVQARTLRQSRTWLTVGLRACRLAYMSWYRRWYQEGGLYFFSLVTFGRRPFLTIDLARRQLHAALRKTQKERPFDIVAMVLLPDHLHCLWKLPVGDDDFSTRWRLVKSRFTIDMLASGFRELGRNESRRKRQEHAIWQRRFWEHLIEDEEDWKRHLDYIHYNPVKHGHASLPRDWEFSTMRRYIAMGEYDDLWGNSEPETLRNWSPPECPDDP
jgi:putative transposase